ncbi:hypothetical protein [Haemophilus haemolyticus]|uniref:hypothetical protein n=1 Tax=Haemophilus haemolyticus TaxID=726 RepID=UPI000318FF6E|nr:hypothetical protein [Haemophilus haemolyticus]
MNKPSKSNFYKNLDTLSDAPIFKKKVEAAQSALSKLKVTEQNLREMNVKH